LAGDIITKFNQPLFSTAAKNNLMRHVQGLSPFALSALGPV
jgi:hypothetical protein